MDSEIRSLQSPNKLYDYYHKAYFRLGIAKNQAALSHFLLVIPTQMEHHSSVCRCSRQIKSSPASAHFFINYSLLMNFYKLIAENRTYVCFMELYVVKFTHEPLWRFLPWN